jgi:PAS domain S-box-containing protein
MEIKGTIIFTETGFILTPKDGDVEVYQKNEIVGKNIRELFYTDDKPLATKNLENLLTADSMFSQWEIRKRKKSGEIIWVKETARIIKLY